MKPFREIVNEVWETNDLAHKIWAKTIEWVDRQYQTTKEPFGFYTSKERVAFRKVHPEYDDISFEEIYDPRLEKPYAVIPMFPTIWHPNGMNYIIPLDAVFADDPETLKELTYDDEGHSMGMIISYDEVGASSLSTETNKYTNDLRLHMNLGAGISEDDRIEAIHLWKNQMRFAITKDITPYVWSDHIIHNLKTKMLKNVFAHEFTHFMDTKKNLQHVGKSSLIGKSTKEGDADREIAHTGLKWRKRYHNKPTEVNAHTNEILQQLDDIGMTPHIKDQNDLRKLFMHMMVLNNDPDQKQRWIQYKQFLQTMTAKNYKKFMRRLRQHQVKTTGKVAVKNYFRKDGTPVRQYRRDEPTLPLNKESTIKETKK
jgi:hypothetical protein